ncbi:MAG: hypothetical protein ACXVBW_10335, partial [Bdellovibrionota bacterium]
GTPQGRSDAIGRFESVVDTGRSPDDRVRVPQTNYQGEDNAYQKLVGPIPAPRDIIKNEISFDGLKVYDDWDATYLGEKQPLTLADLWFDDGQYAFEKARWYDSNLAIQTWLKRPIDTRPKYDNLNANAPVITPATPAVPATATTPAVPAKPEVRMDLQAIFQKSFVDSYGYYVAYYFSSQFQRNLDQGQFEGEAIGQQVGKRIANVKGLSQAFNKKYKESSASSFRQSYVSAYTGSFNTTFQDYAANPKLSVQLLEIIGLENIGILEPGEPLAAKFKVVNSGGTGGDLNVSLLGSVVEGTPQTFSIGALRSQVYTTAQIAKIDPRLRAHQDANLVLDVNGQRSGTSETVQQIIEIASSGSGEDALAGNLQASVQINNIATVRTPGPVSVELELNGYKAGSQIVGLVEKGDSRNVVISTSGWDPFQILKGEISGQLTVKMGDRVMDTREVTFTKTATEKEFIPAYFNLLANGRGSVPRGKSFEDRMAEAKAWVVSLDGYDVDGNKGCLGDNTWGNSPSQTVAGKMADIFDGSGQNEQAKAQYDDLARRMWDHRKMFHCNLVSGKRKAFERLCQKIAKSKLK